LSYNPSNNKNIFNLGNDKPFSVLEIIELVEEVTKKKIHLVRKERRFGDAEALYSKSLEARNLLKWSPNFKALKESINHAVNWKIKQDLDG
jgi:UDP-glucose 4-epimerase